MEAEVLHLLTREGQLVKDKSEEVFPRISVWDVMYNFRNYLYEEGIIKFGDLFGWKKQ